MHVPIKISPPFTDRASLNLVAIEEGSKRIESSRAKEHVKHEPIKRESISREGLAFPLLEKRARIGWLFPANYIYVRTYIPRYSNFHVALSAVSSNSAFHKNQYLLPFIPSSFHYEGEKKRRGKRERKRRKQTMLRLLTGATI